MGIAKKENHLTAYAETRQAVATEHAQGVADRSRLAGGRISLAVWLSSLAILSLSAVLFTQPGYMDAYYYQHVASNVAAGRGFVEDYIWNYLPPPDAVSHPSNLYWMPLTSLAIVPFFQLLGDSFRAAQVPFVLLASLLILFTFWLGLWLSGNLRSALAASALTLFGGFYFTYWTSPDSFALFALSANAVLLLSYGLLLGSSFSFAAKLGISALAGGFAGLSHLARADGALLLAVAVAMIGMGAWRSRRRGSSLSSVDDALVSESIGGEPSRYRTTGDEGWVREAALAIAVCLAVYVLVMSPWFVRNWQSVGSILPTAGLKTLFLREYNDFYTYDKDLSWQSFLSWGLWPILRSKMEALGTNTLVLFGMEYHLVPFAVIGLWHLRRKTAFIPFFVYAGALYLTMSLLFTFPAGRGSMLHSSAALLPWLSIAAVAGLDQSVVWAAKRLRHWNVPLAQRNFTLILVVFAVAFSAYLLLQEAGRRDERHRHYNDVAAWLRETAPDSLVMTADPPGYFYSSGKGSIVIPSDGLDTVLLAARRYGASYLVLEKVHSRPLHPYYKGESSDPRLQKVAELGTTQIYRIEER